MHFRKTCVENAVFYGDDIVCRKCGNIIGFRYKDTGGNKVYLYDDYAKYCHVLKPYNEIPELAPASASMQLDMDDIHKEILSVLKEPLKYEDFFEDDSDKDDVIKEIEEEFGVEFEIEEDE